MLRTLLNTTAVPELPDGFVPRPHLWRRLAAAGDDQLVAVVAPAGFGKTLLLAEWARLGGGPATAWLNVDRDDGGPGRLWAAMLAALVALPSVPPDGALARIHRSARGHDAGDLTDHVDDILCALDELDPPVRLVIDDVHELGRHQTAALDRLVRSRPAGLRVVLSSRADPPLSLPRLRMDGGLCELRADDLRFGLDDAAALLRPRGLATHEVATLHRRTEGWVAGLRLAAVALARSEDRRAFLDEFSGADRAVADYLAQEVLSALPPGSLDMLRNVSTCARLPVELAVELAGRSDAGHLLDDLRHESGLVERTAHGEFRIHAMLRSYLTVEMARHQRTDHRDRHAVAARWWARHEEPVHALRHAEHAGDAGLIGDILRRHGMSLVFGGEIEPVRRALELVEGIDPGARRDLDDVSRAAALLAAGLGAAPGHPSVSPGALPEIETDDVLDPEAEALLHASRAAAELDPRTGGDLARSRGETEGALRLARAHGFAYLEVNALALVGLLDLIDGDHRGSREVAAEAVDVAVRQGHHPSRWTALPLFLLSYSDLLRGDPARAEARAAEGIDADDPLPAGTVALLHGVHGCALADRGEPVRGLAETRAARRALGDEPLPPVVATALAVLEHRTALAVGNPRAAEEVSSWLSARLGRTGELELMRAWEQSAAGRHAVAGTMAAALREPGTPGLLASTAVEAHLLDTEAALHAGEPERARSALEAAVTRAEALDVLRPFALAGPHTRDLLAARAGRQTTAFTARVAAVRAAVVAPGAAIPLSEREQLVLSLLPSLLSAPEMADELIVSVNTVKTQIRSIYTKLGVSTRRAAVLAAHERGLLS